MNASRGDGQPPEKQWAFVEDLKRPLHGVIRLGRSRARDGEVSFRTGVNLDFRFPDRAGLLETACADFRKFLGAGGIPAGGGFTISSEKADTGAFESYRLEISDERCRVLANDTEGIRRGLVFIEDEILRGGGPFLKKGVFEREPFIKTRISRCFFGPIKRPPMNRDELADDADYYPDEYLNRLAHEGINGLWLTVSFSDLCRSRFFPSHGADAGKRLEKLGRTVGKCLRYGIRIYLFCIEPRGFGGNPEFLLSPEALERHEYFRGHDGGRFTYFCTSSREGLEYIRCCARDIFCSVPGLGGLIDINLGERPTHCYSSISAFFGNNCPRCSKREPGEVFKDTVSALAEGIHEANPAAEMISWLYVPSLLGRNEEDVKKTEAVLEDIAGHMPREVVFQYNFESGGKALQLGKERALRDYWLAWPGPSGIFRKCAESAAAGGARVSAKIQAGCSHEAATVPFIPVPGNLYRKYSEMRALKVSSVMQCWYFGNYPGTMNKAAGELSFGPFFSSEEEFTVYLAGIDWGKNAEKVAGAWKLFREAYANFPYNLSFAWYGPVHNSVVWPLYLEPADKPISPSWQFTFPLESGDRIGECLCYDHTLDEALELLEAMSVNWDRGVKILESLEHCYKDNTERLKDIGLARALNIQFRSAWNIFRFYKYREELPYSGYPGMKRILDAMKGIVREEISNSLCLKKLCLGDPRLGFHSEAEGYKYDPEQLGRRADGLEKLLCLSFPKILRQIESGKPVFPRYTGEKPEGRQYVCAFGERDSARENLSDGRTSWRAWHDGRRIMFDVECPGPPDGDDLVELKIEPRRLWPAQSFFARAGGKKGQYNFKTVEDRGWTAQVYRDEQKWKAVFSVPFEIFEGFYRPGAPMRVNILRGGASWAGLNPLEGRLRLGSDNPGDLGWFFFAGKT